MDIDAFIQMLDDEIEELEHQEVLKRIDAEAEALWQLSEEELDARLIEEGFNPETHAEQTRQLIERAIENHFARQGLEKDEHPLSAGAQPR